MARKLRARLRRLALALGLVAGCAVAGPMSLDGQFEVTPMGASSYTIPIQVPPGTAGIEPKISLVYNSQSGNGLLGVGWSLSGLSAITRCPRTMAQDGVRGGVNFDANDRFCLDGQRLMVVSGTYGADGAEYRTERESFSKVVSYGSAGNGPAWFKVWTKAGQIIEYGNTTDSRIEAQGKSSARVWAMNKLSDTKGNYLTVSYTEDATNGDYVPSRIDYTGNTNTALVPNNFVQFVYEARPSTDIVTLYLAGSLIKSTQRLKTVQAYADASLSKELRLTYGTGTTTNRSRITSLTECAQPANVCKPAVVPAWTEYGSHAFNAGSNWTTLAASFFADVNGDGRADLIGQKSDGIYVALSSGTGGGTISKWLSSFGSSQGYSDQKITPLFVVDVNADGLADVVGIASDGVYVALSNGSGFNAATKWGSDFGTATGWTNMDTYPRTFADVNGDGRPDLVGFKNDGVYIALNTGTAFNAATKWIVDFGTATPTVYTTAEANPRLVADMNGDGLADIVGFANGGTYVALNTGSAFATATLWLADFGVTAGWTTQDTYPRTLADVNGDGLPDVVGFKSDGVYVATNTGTGLQTATKWLSEFGTATATAYSSQKGFPRYLADVNGDGKADIVGFAANGVQVALGTGSGFNPSTQWVAGFGSAAGYGTTSPRQLADFDGDGFPDVAGTLASGTTIARTARTNPPDWIASLANGVGATTTLTYGSLPAASLYLRGAGATYPQADITAPLYVVATAKLPNALGSGYITNNYKYGGLRVDLSGRGPLGFGWMEEIQSDTNITTHTDYRQDWPYSGLPFRVLKYFQGNSGYLSATSLTYACLNPANGAACTIAAGSRYFPYVNKKTEATWDTNGVAYPVSMTTNSFDQYGNATAITVTTEDGTSKTTTNTYTNDTTNWFLGRLTRTTVSSSIGNTPSTINKGIFTFNDTIAANVSNYNLKTKAIAAGWDQVSLLVANVVINSGITVSSSSNSTPAFDVGSGYPGQMRISIVNNGTIIGRGGNGGGGTNVSTTTFAWGTPAGNGGPGLSTGTLINVTNNGTIAGGGGGGAAGNGYKANVPWPVGSTIPNQTAYAASSGGGGGAGGSTGGAAGVASGQTLIVSGNAGSAGTSTAGGAGGATAACWQYATLKANPGGSGGAPGQPGQAGSNSYSYLTIPYATQFGTAAIPPSPGAGGASVLNNLFIAWAASGTRLGELK